MAKEAVQYAEIPQEEFQKILKKDLGVKDKNLNKITIYKDSLNYVKEVQIGENRFDGEEFREAFELPSSCYFLEKINNKIEIKTIGIGHGYGFSQYSAHCMASTGNDYRQLLTYFFANIALEKI